MLSWPIKLEEALLNKPTLSSTITTKTIFYNNKVLRK